MEKSKFWKVISIIALIVTLGTVAVLGIDYKLHQDGGSISSTPASSSSSGGQDFSNIK